ncbi:uncharacterized protein LOC132599299 [Lycium barbarum]|uniref:uncharacterized protein LOC132599299 n=1 Tax=Lycium barbarum TaxID=112863 RepID=UPI00293E3CBF|nr:uncharacterized protein LOC132599299 [Lycium barbarum]
MHSPKEDCGYGLDKHQKVGPVPLRKQNFYLLSRREFRLGQLNCKGTMYSQPVLGPVQARTFVNETGPKFCFTVITALIVRKINVGCKISAEEEFDEGPSNCEKYDLEFKYLGGFGAPTKNSSG